MRYPVLILLFIIAVVKISDAQDTIKPKNLRLTGIVLPSHTPENGWYAQGGVIGLFSTAPKDSTVRISNLYLFGLYSQMKQYRISQGGEVFFPQEKFYLYYWLYHSYFPETYFGTGNQVNQHRFESINYKVNHANMMFLKKIRKNVFVGPNITFENVYQLKYIPNGMMDTSSIAGKDNYTLMNLGLRLQIDHRNQVINTTKGLFFSTEISKTWQTVYANYFSSKSDLRYFIPIKKNTLAFQFINAYNHGQIPFRQLAQLNTRGYHPNLYRSNAATSFQTEARIKLLNWLSLSAFGGAGGVGKSMVVVKNWQWNAGGGFRLRLIKQYNMYMRVEMGIGAYGNSNLYFSFSDAF